MAVIIPIREAIPDDVSKERDAAFSDAVEQVDNAALGAVPPSIVLSEQITSLLRNMSQDPDQIFLQLDALRTSLGTTADEWASVLSDIAAQSQSAIVQVGQEIVDRPLIVAQFEFGAAQTVVQELDMLIDFAQSRITDVSREVIEKVMLEVRLVALGSKSFTDAMDEVIKLVPPTGTGGGAAFRAEMILRTEVGRVLSFATQERFEDLEEQIPGLMKEWKHSGNLINPRDGHIAADGQRVAINDTFSVAATLGGTKENIRFPRAPEASARNSIFCRCAMVPWHQSWED